VTNKLILVTGAHRSGTTWVGKMLASGPDVAYIHEPFNIKKLLGYSICGAKFPYWFTYIDSFNEKDYYGELNKTFSLKYNFPKAISFVDSPYSFHRVIKEYYYFTKHRQIGSKIIVKDPLAFFSTVWLQQKFGFSILVIIRHPAAFANSLIRLGWSHPFSHFVFQPELIRIYLDEYREIITEYSEKEYPIIDQAILLWKIIYSTAFKFKEKHKDWIFIRHEDLSQNPLIEFEELFSRLGLVFNNSVKENLLKYSESSNEISTDPYNIQRKSREIIKKWKSNLSNQEIQKIRSNVEQISQHFYDESDW